MFPSALLPAASKIHVIKQYDFQSIAVSNLEVIKSRKLQDLRGSYKHEVKQELHGFNRTTIP